MQSYIKVMRAAANLLLVIMTEIGKMPLESAKKIISALLQATIGKPE